MKRLLLLSSLALSIAQADDGAQARRETVTGIPGLVAFWDFVKREPGGGRFLAHVPEGADNDYPLDAGNYVKEYWGQGRDATYDDFPLLGRGPFGQAIQIRHEGTSPSAPCSTCPESACTTPLSTSRGPSDPSPWWPGRSGIGAGTPSQASGTRAPT